MLYSLDTRDRIGKKYGYDGNAGSEADEFAFTEGIVIQNGEVVFQTPQGETKRWSAKGMRMRADCKLSAFKKSLFLPNICGLPIFRIDLIEELRPWLGDQLQYFDMELTTKDAVTNDYKVANITHTVQAYDLEKSDLSWWNEDKPYKSVSDIHRLVFRDDSCMGSLQIARELFRTSTIVVTDEFKNWFEGRGINNLFYLRDFEVRA